MSIRVLISDEALTGHPESVRDSVISGYGEGLTAAEVEIVALGMEDAINYANRNFYTGIAIVRSISDLDNCVPVVAEYYPYVHGNENQVFMPLGSNSSVELTAQSEIPLIVTCGAGQNANQTAYGAGLEFWDQDLDAVSPALSSFSTGRIAGKMLRIKDELGTSWDDARARARATASNLGVWDKYNGYGKIDVNAAIGYIAYPVLTMHFTASTKTLSDSETELTSANVGYVAQFYDADSNPYYGVVASVPSSRVAVLTGDNLPTADMDIYDLALIEPDVEAVATSTQGIGNGLKCFVTDDDLKAYAPNIVKYLWASQTDYSLQISEAFHRVMNDLRRRGYDTRTLGNVIPLTSASVEGRDGFNRFAVSVTEPVTTASIVLEGSVDGSDWTAVVAIDVSNYTGVKSVKIDNQYFYYRVTVAGTEPVFTAALSETYHDRLIVQRTFAIIYPQFAKEPNDIWMMRAVQAEADYNDEMDSIKPVVDTNADGTVDAADEVKTTQRTFSR